MTHVLDNPVWAALTGAHGHLGRVSGQAAAYPTDVAPFAALRPRFEGGAWADLAAVVDPGVEVALAGFAGTPPPDWEVTFALDGVQLVDTSVRAAPDPEAVRLGPADVPDMLDLVARTDPGPFRERTVELGTYLGIRRAGALVAMTGERVHPPGWTEISAVCTDPDHRGQGLATRLVRAVAHGIRARGETPFLHAAATNTGAIRLYEAIGFTLRRKTTFTVVKAPA